MNSALGKQNAHIQKGTAMIRPSGRAGHQRNDTSLPSGECFLASKNYNFFFI